MAKSDEDNKRIKKEAIRQLGLKYVAWYDKELANFKKFWLHEFVYPIVFPFDSLAILKYIFHYTYTREQSSVLFALLYMITIVGRIVSKFDKLIKTLDPLVEPYFKKEKVSE